MNGDRASRTAVFVCQGRAVADGRLAAGRFADPVAARLLGGDELRLVELARSDAPPADWRERLLVEALRGCAEVVAPRTVAIDEAVAEAGNEQVAIVGAGLDSRPWRLAALREAAVLLVDHPASLDDAQRRSAGLAPLARRLDAVPADLRSVRLDAALEGRLDRAVATTWIWEGVVPYLTRDQVEATVAAIAACSAPGSVLLVNYQTPSLFNRTGRHLAGGFARLARQPNMLAGEPWRSLWKPDAMRRLLAAHGFGLRDDRSLLELAALIGTPARRRRSLVGARVAVAAAS